MATWATGCSVEISSIVVGFTAGKPNGTTVSYNVLDPSSKVVVSRQINIKIDAISSSDMTALGSLHSQAKTAALSKEDL